MVTTVAESVAGTAAKAPAANFMSERHKNEEVDDVSSTSSEKGNHGLVPFSKTWTSEILYGRLYNVCLPWHLVHLCLADCNIRDANIPYDHLWSLEQLDLRGNLMCSLPKSIGSLNKLQRLWLDHCTSLQSLPELPKNLEMLSVRDCLSLEISSPFFLLLSQPHPLLRCSLLDVITNHDDDPFEFYLNRSAYRRNPHECFVSLSVLERMMPGGVEKLQSLTRLRKRGVFGFCQFKAKANEQIFRIDGQRVEQNLTVPASLIGIESTSSVDILPCYLVELDLKDCNVSDEDSILKNITSLCSLKYLNLSGNLISYLPESIVKLAELKCLKMSRCKMLHSLPELPPGLEKLKLCHCSSLQKAVNLPNLFRSLQLDVRNCDHLVEIQELFILQTMENNDVEAVHNFRLLEQKSTGDIEISLFNFLTYSMRMMSLQILYECGIVSVYLPGRKVPYWFSYNMKGGSSQDLIVPSLVGNENWSLNLCLVYGLSYVPECNGLPLLLARVRNKTKHLKWTYCPTFIGMPSESENMLWFSHWKFKYQLESGDRVDISSAYSAEFYIKQYGVDFVYGDKDLDMVSDTKAAVKDRPLHSRTLSEMDTSVYKVQEPAKAEQEASYLLSNHHYPTSSDKYWLDQFLQLNPDFI